MAGGNVNPSELFAPRPSQPETEGIPASEAATGREEDDVASQLRTEDVSEAGAGPASAVGNLAAAPMISPSRPIPRPLPPPAPEGEDDLNPFLGRTLRRSPKTGVSIPPPAEPELPPSVDDPVSSTPPRGIHSGSSPSARRNTRSQPSHSSPLKQKPLFPAGEENVGEELAPRKLFGASKAAPPAPSRFREDTALVETTDNVRRLPSNHEDPGKRKKRDELRNQLAKLNKDLETTTRQNERLRAMQKSGRKVGLTDEDEVLRLIKDRILPHDASSQPQQQFQVLAAAALNPMAIVPFAKPSSSAVPTKSDEIDISDIKSHHPVPMKAKEELPYLQLFTPFDATSSLVVLPRKDDDPLRQLYTIQLRSRHHAGLFGAKIAVTVDTTKLLVQSLRILALEPAAKPELGSFLEKICSGDCNRSMQRNVGIATWAMAEWLRVAEQRARLWSELHRETATTDLILESSKDARTRRRKRAASGEERDTPSKDSTLVRRDLLRFLGEQNFVLQVPASGGPGLSSTLQLTWKIDFDWTGEAQSKVCVMIGVPGQCKFLRYLLLLIPTLIFHRASC